MTAGTFLQPHGVSTRVMSYMCFMNSKLLTLLTLLTLT